MGQFNLSMTADPIMLAGFIQGLGTGLMFAPLNTLGYATLDPSRIPAESTTYSHLGFLACNAPSLPNSL